MYVCVSVGFFCKSRVALQTLALIKNLCYGFYPVVQGNIWGVFFNFFKISIFQPFLTIQKWLKWTKMKKWVKFQVCVNMVMLYIDGFEI